MAITRRNELANYGGLRQLNRLLDDAFSTWPFENQGTITSAWIPPCDIMEDAAQVRIVMEIPGVRPEDVKLSLENNILTIRGEKRQEEQGESDDRRVHRYERSYGVAVGSLIIFAIALLFSRWLGARTLRAQLAVGLCWVVLTVAFEIGLGMLLGVLVILAAWMLIWIYVRWANTHYDAAIAGMRR